MNLLAVASFIAAFLLSSVEASVGTEEVAFGAVRLELHSKSSSEARLLLSDLVTRTSTFLDKELQKYFSESTSISGEYYSHTVLGVVDFKIEQTGDVLYSAIIDFEGSSFFTTVPLPGAGFIVNLFKDAFQGDSRLDYVRDLQSSDIPFLRDVSFVVVELNNQVIASEDMTTDNTNKDSTGSGTLSTESMALIVARSSAAALALCLVAFAFFYCKRSKKASKLRVKTIQSNQGTSEDPESPVHSPSPVHSICSQESSKFTYNPRSIYTSTSSISALTMETKTISSHFSSLNVDIDNGIDMGEWTRQTTISPMTPAPFGHDISAIEPSGKDLSLVMEGTDEDYTPASQKSSRASLTKSALRDLDEKIMNVDWNHRNCFNDSYQSEGEGYEVSDHSDVISDLNNLSLQIDKHRGSTGSAKPLYGRSDD